jgi:hypothetical protein
LLVERIDWSVLELQVDPDALEIGGDRTRMLGEDPDVLDGGPDASTLGDIASAVAVLVVGGQTHLGSSPDGVERIWVECIEEAALQRVRGDVGRDLAVMFRGRSVRGDGDDRRPIDRQRHCAADVDVVEGRNGRVHRHGVLSINGVGVDARRELRILTVSGHLLQRRGGAEHHVEVARVHEGRDLVVVPAERDSIWSA